MRAVIRDRDTLSSLRPFEIAQYLRVSGWVRIEAVKQRYSVWTHSQYSSIELVLPESSRFADFPLRMAEFLAKLEEAEERSQLQLLSDLENASSDVIRIRLRAPDGVDGSVPFEDAPQTFQAAQEMMIAAACAAIRPKQYYHSPRPTQVNEFIEGLRLGQSERGSYVIRILSRVPPAVTPADEGKLLPVDEPYPRLVSQTLARALAAMLEAVSTSEIPAFEQAVPQGISANLCLAVSGLGRREHLYSDVDIDLNWSPTRPPDIELPTRFALPSDALPFIEEVGRVLKEKAPLENCEVIGKVVKLDRGAKAKKGRITIWGVADGITRNVQVQLGEAYYPDMVNAHRDRTTVTLTGELIKESGKYELRNPRSIHTRCAEDNS